MKGSEEEEDGQWKMVADSSLVKIKQSPGPPGTKTCTKSFGDKQGTN